MAVTKCAGIYYLCIVKCHLSYLPYYYENNVNILRHVTRLYSRNGLLLTVLYIEFSNDVTQHIPPAMTPMRPKHVVDTSYKNTKVLRNQGMQLYTAYR